MRLISELTQRQKVHVNKHRIKNVWKSSNMLFNIFYNRSTNAANGPSNAQSNVANGNTTRVSTPQSMTEVQTACHSHNSAIMMKNVLTLTLTIETWLQIHWYTWALLRDSQKLMINTLSCFHFHNSTVLTEHIHYSNHPH